MRVIFLILIGFLLFTSASNAQKRKKSVNKTDTTAKQVAPKPKWLPAGLSEKIIHKVGVSRTNQKLVFASNDEEGIFRSTDSGIEWQLVDKTKGTIGFLFERMRPNVVYSIHPYCVRKSEDEGKTFTDMFLTTTKGSLKVTCVTLDESPSSMAKAVLVGTTEGVFKTFNRVDFQPAGLADFQINSMDASVVEGRKPTIYAATTSGLFKSENYGLSWIPLVNGIPQTNILQVITDIKKHLNIYAVTEKNGVYRSIDGGETWEQIANEIPQLSGFQLTSSVDAASQRSVIYMVNYTGECFITENDGKNWRKVGDKLDGVTGLGIATSSIAPTSIYIGTLKGVFKYEP